MGGLGGGYETKWDIIEVWHVFVSGATEGRFGKKKS